MVRNLLGVGIVSEVIPSTPWFTDADLKYILFPFPSVLSTQGIDSLAMYEFVIIISMNSTVEINIVLSSICFWVCLLFCGCALAWFFQLMQFCLFRVEILIFSSRSRCILRTQMGLPRIHKTVFCLSLSHDYGWCTQLLGRCFCSTLFRPWYSHPYYANCRSSTRSYSQRCQHWPMVASVL